MFNNLIESSSHTKEFKRRGSFLLFTTATYFVLFVITGVISIYAYDARLEENNLEIVTLLPPQELIPEVTEPAHTPRQPKPSSSEQSEVPQRAVAMLSVNHPEVVPENVSAAPGKNLPLPESGPVVISGIDKGPAGPGGNTAPGGGGQQIIQPRQVTIVDDPPPVPDPTPVVPRVLKVSKVLNSEALVLPRPPYPTLAKQIRLQGTVVIQVLIDESGKVLSAKPVSGHPMLIGDSQRAALQARFSPTTVNGQPVKVSGVITYNFVLPN
jgi:protein TonB